MLPAQGSAQGNYLVGEDSKSADAGPVRMAHLSYQSGGVSWRPSNSVGWSQASLNVPFRQGSQIWAKSGRAEVQFDDGSVMRLAASGFATLATMYSDSNGEFTEIKLNDGIGQFMLRNKLSEYQVDTPGCAVKAYGPAELRIGVGNGTEIAVTSGQCEVDGPNGAQSLKAGEHLVVQGSNARLTSAPPWDNFDHFCENRDHLVAHHNRYVPRNIDLVAGDLDSYGTWHHDGRYGEVWTPTAVATDWRPYEDGDWTWVSPFGWTWCDYEPWAWAPCHYGTWVHESYGWGWCPGPVTQYWSPAVVDFSYDGLNVAWAPLAPAEVVYPNSLTIGFASGDWSLFFSIGQAGCYFPAGPSYCLARPWANYFVNTEPAIYDPTIINNYYGETVSYTNGYYGVSAFRPINAFQAPGATWAAAAAFTSTAARFRPLDPRQATIFQRGRSFTGVPNRGSQIFGPLAVRPSRASFTPSRHFANAGPPAAIAQRSVFRAPVAANIARHGAAFGRATSPSSRTTTRVAGRAPANRAPIAANANRYNRFNNVSKNPFTNRSSRATTAAMHRGTAPGKAPTPNRPLGRRNGASRAPANRPAGAGKAPIGHGGRSPNRAPTRRGGANRARRGPSRVNRTPVRRAVRSFNRPNRMAPRGAAPRRSFARSPRRSPGTRSFAPRTPTRTRGGGAGFGGRRMGSFGDGRPNFGGRRSSGSFGGSRRSPSPGGRRGGFGGGGRAPVSRPSGGGGKRKRGG